MWEHVPTRVLAAGALPADVGGYGCLPLIAGPQAPILESGIRAGMQLSVAELRNILQLRNIDPPPNKTGSGANGNVVKRDLVTVLVNALFPDMNEQTRTELIEKMAGKPRENTSLDESELNLKLVAHLDVQEQPHFKTIVKDALDHLEATKERARLKEKQREMHAAEGRDAPAAGVNPFAGAHGSCGERASAPRAKAPTQFTSLLPPLDSLYLHFEPQNRRVWVEFKRSQAALVSIIISGVFLVSSTFVFNCARNCPPTAHCTRERQDCEIISVPRRHLGRETLRRKRRLSACGRYLIGAGRRTTCASGIIHTMTKTTQRS